MNVEKMFIKRIWKLRHDLLNIETHFKNTVQDQEWDISIDKERIQIIHKIEKLLYSLMDKYRSYQQALVDCKCPKWVKRIAKEAEK